MSDIREYFVVRVGGLGARCFNMTAIKSFYLEYSSEEHSSLSKLVVTTKAPTINIFYFKKKSIAEKAFLDIKEAIEDKVGVSLKLIKEINKHLLHPADR